MSAYDVTPGVDPICIFEPGRDPGKSTVTESGVDEAPAVCAGATEGSNMHAIKAVSFAAWEWVAGNPPQDVASEPRPAVRNGD